MTTMGLDDLGTATPLEANQSLGEKLRAGLCPPPRALLGGDVHPGGGGTSVMRSMMDRVTFDVSMETGTL